MKVTLLNMTDPGIADMAAKCCISRELPDNCSEGCKSLKTATSAGHYSILEHIIVSFSVSGISRACSHQLVRHRLASYAQQSQRYVSLDDFEYVTPDSIASNPKVKEAYDKWMAQCADFYQIMTELQDIPNEDARYIYPNACCTNIVITMNARELMTYFKYRLCNRAQWEIRELAQRMYDLCVESAPEVFGWMGPSCKVLGYCPEGRKTCGRPISHQALDSEDGQ